MSIISHALTLFQEHIDAWSHLTDSHHPYWTRAEKKRIFTAIRDRDVAFVRHYMELVCSERSLLERVEASIIMMVYLTKAHFMFQNTTFRVSLWKKLYEFESQSHRELVRINDLCCIEEYEKETTLRYHFHELLIVIEQLRDIIRTFWTF